MRRATSAVASALCSNAAPGQRCPQRLHEALFGAFLDEREAADAALGDRDEASAEW